MKCLPHTLLTAALVFACAGAAHAQRPMRQVLDLNRQAMEHYNNMDFEEAQAKLEQALRAARRGRVRGAPLARTHLNLGVVLISGFGDNGGGMDHFVAALQADSNVRLDPLTSTPDIQTMFQLARQRAGSGGGGSDSHTPPSPPPRTGPGTIPHQPAAEQLARTAVPVFIEVPREAPVEHVYLYYKGHGMRDFRRVEMRTTAGGYGFEIPCADVFEPRMSYYIVAFDDEDRPLGFAGSAQQPVVVPIVGVRTQAPPALPGAVPPPQCSDEECPPNMPGCHSGGGGGGGMGDSCLSGAECRAGLSCIDGYCGSDGDGGGGSDDGEPGAGPRFFVHVGLTGGFAFASSGMLADSSPMGAEPVYIAEGVGDCPATGDDRDYCVRIEQSGFVPTLALRFTAGGYITDRIGAAVTFRLQPNAGEGASSNLLLGVRGQYLLTPPAALGFQAAAYVGTSYGQIQAQPPQKTEPEPFIRAGLNGLQLGGVFIYRIAENFGFHVTPEFHFLFPLFLFNIDVTFGVEAAF